MDLQEVVWRSIPPVLNLFKMYSFSVFREIRWYCSPFSSAHSLFRKEADLQCRRWGSPAVLIKTLDFWDVMTCRRVSNSGRFEGFWWLRHKGEAVLGDCIAVKALRSIDTWGIVYPATSVLLEVHFQIWIFLRNSMVRTVILLHTIFLVPWMFRAVQFTIWRILRRLTVSNHDVLLKEPGYCAEKDKANRNY